MVSWPPAVLLPSQRCGWQGCRRVGGVSYTVLARRYRSRDFDEVVGQSAVAETLKRAVEQDRMAHAYLFCGTRGVGTVSYTQLTLPTTPYV